MGRILETSAHSVGRRTIFGAWAAVSVLHVFIVEAIVGSAWAGPMPYNPVAQVVSDLGAVRCGVHNGHLVCSPLHTVMNVSFELQGLAMILGGLLLSSTLLGIAGKRPGAEPQLLAAHWSRALLMVCGLGVILVGLFPEDVVPGLHYTGAALFFGAGSLAQLLLWWIWWKRSPASWVLLSCGVISVAATVVLSVCVFWLKLPGFPTGLVERLIVYPVILGFAAAGLTIARGLSRPRRRRLRRSGQRSPQTSA
ncbi:DUF998 domain-containing protein [Psychromicrobium xiongbiense]|uniref:DUF998 domain-containing protein n=1 Tax=Psychromicrobium xiongbiense TaxID=3051184 RepID=UPI002555ABFB|nr:DUF998 domain-containing protein [Psychromicrobium sp. YIM S02556]